MIGVDVTKGGLFTEYITIADSGLVSSDRPLRMARYSSGDHRHPSETFNSRTFHILEKIVETGEYYIRYW